MDKELEIANKLISDHLLLHDLSEIYIPFENSIMDIIEKIKGGNKEYIEKAFDTFNFFADLNQENIDDLLCIALYVNLWNELDDAVFFEKLSERSKKLYKEAIFLQSNPQTRSEILKREKGDDLD